MKYPITAVILAKNEENNIKKCIDSANFCSEIIVIDDFSNDKTKEIALKMRVKVFQRELKGDFAEQRNFGLSKSTNDWILFVDSDEEVSKELKESCVSNINDSYYTAYYIKRRDYWWGNELRFGEIQKVRNLGIVRLVKKNTGKWMGNVHEVFYTANKIGTLNGFLNHYPHPTIKNFLQDINEYSSLRANELYNQGKNTNIFEIIIFPLTKFVLNYFIYFGFLDGAPGFVYSFFMSFHSFLVRCKLYQYRNIDKKSL